MKTKSIKIIILVVITALMAVIMTACGAQTFDASGAAVITITLDKTYEDVYVSCPGAAVTGSGTSYEVKLSTRAEADVIVSCRGYYTEYLNFKTKELKTGKASRTVSLRDRDAIVTVSIKGISDTAGVSIESAGDLFKSEPVQNSSGTFTLTYDEAVSDTIIVSKKDYADNTIDFKETSFYDYSLDVSAPLLPKGDTGDAAITFIGTTFYSSVYIYRYGYTDHYLEQTVSVGGTDRIAYVDREKNYSIVIDGTPILVKSKQLTDNPYLVLDPSEYMYNRREITVTAPGRTDFYEDIRFNNHCFISINQQVYTVTLNYNGQSYSAAINIDLNSVNSNNTMRMLWYHDDPAYFDGEKFYALYEKAGITRNELLSGIAIENKIEDLTSETLLVDEEGIPFTLYEEPEGYGSSIVYTKGQNKIGFNIKDFCTKTYGITFSVEDDAYEQLNINPQDTLTDRTFVVRAYHNVKMKFINSAGEFVPEAEKDILDDGYYDFKRRLFGDDIDDIQLDGYAAASGLTFDKDIFTYDSTDDKWYYTLEVYVEKQVSYLLPRGVSADHERTELYFFVNGNRIQFNRNEGKFSIREFDIGKSLSVSIYAYNANESRYVQYNHALQISSDMLEDDYLLDMTNLMPQGDNYYDKY